jgi:gluconolactonase
MRTRRYLVQFALVAIGAPLALYGYACSSSSSNPIDETDGGSSSGTSGTSSGTSGTSSGTSGASSGTSGTSGTSGSSGTVDAGDAGDGGAKDAGDAGNLGDGGVVCVGNPLLSTAALLTPDGGALVDSGADGGPLSIVDESLNAAGAYLDGPQWFEPGGFLVYSEYIAGKTMRVNLDGGAKADFRPSVLPFEPIGNAVRNGLVLSAAASTALATPSVILQTLPDGGAYTPLSVGTAVSPNDLVIGNTGAIYFTDPTYQIASPTRGIYQTLADGGGASPFATFNGGEEPNGIALSPNGTLLYVAFTSPKRIDSYVVPANGSIAVKALNVQSTPVIPAASLVGSPDGIAVDVGGNIYVGEKDPNGTTGRVQVFKPTGELWGQLAFPTFVTSVAFGGPGNAYLFITVEKGVYVYKGRCAGLP